MTAAAQSAFGLLRRHEQVRSRRGRTDHQVAADAAELTAIERAIAAAPAAGAGDVAVKLRLALWLLRETGADPVAVDLIASAVEGLAGS